MKVDFKIKSSPKKKSREILPWKKPTIRENRESKKLTKERLKKWNGVTRREVKSFFLKVARSYGGQFKEYREITPCNLKVIYDEHPGEDRYDDCLWTISDRWWESRKHYRRRFE